MFKCQPIMMTPNKTCHDRGLGEFSGSADASGVLATFEEVFKMNQSVFGVGT
ncbi:Uncharacterised protein [Staphylococcus intermedius NCTC 11048]|uniref:Uncharacterized protein n=1 Tax=Staphylococcus intermedius NCTC 11048 TaxID=1141106 RepID=A0A380GC23_STAIN|nr:Uncharacterised protein [Staphylococcus intermedius NCTC 11048]